MASASELIPMGTQFRRLPGKSIEESIETYLAKAGYCLFPPGEYKLSRTVNVPAGSSVLGYSHAKTTIIPPDNGFAFSVSTGRGFNDRCTFRDIAFGYRGGGIDFSGEPIYMGNNSRFHTVDNCVFAALPMFGIFGLNLISTTIRNNKFYLCDNPIMLSGQSLWINIMGNSILGGGVAGRIGYGTAISLKGLMPDYSPITDTRAYAAWATSATLIPEGIRIKDNHGEGFNTMVDVHVARQIDIGSNNFDVAYQNVIDVKGSEFVNIDRLYGLAHTPTGDPLTVSSVRMADTAKFEIASSRIPYQNHSIELHSCTQGDIHNCYLENFIPPNHGAVLKDNCTDIAEYNNRIFP